MDGEYRPAERRSNDGNSTDMHAFEFARDIPDVERDDRWPTSKVKSTNS